MLKLGKKKEMWSSPYFHKVNRYYSDRYLILFRMLHLSHIQVLKE
jgi:hypothetical protein